MKKTVALLLTISALLFSSALRADEPASDPNVSFGFGLTGGYSSIWQRVSEGDSPNSWDWGYCYGAGFVVEKMFSNTIGIHSGLWYQGSMVNMNPGDSLKAEATLHSITVPLYLIVSVNKGIFSFNYLIGSDVTVIVDCTIHTDSDMVSNKTANVKKYLNAAQFGFGMGFNFKFRVSHYVDYYIGLIGDFYVSSLERQNDNYESYGHIYDGRLMTGVLFRTNLFPIPDSSGN